MEQTAAWIDAGPGGVRSGKEHMEDHWTIKAMIEYGGSFVSALGHAAACADFTNLAKIKNTWPAYWIKYAELGRKMKVKSEAARS